MRQRDFAGVEGDGDEQGVGAAGREDDAVAVHERTLAGIPFGDSRAELANKIKAPAQFGPVAASQQMTWHFGPHRYATNSGNRRNGARHAMVALHADGITVTPDFTSVGERQTTQSVTAFSRS